MRCAAVVGLVLAGVVVAVRSEALTLCVQQGGHLVVRDACRRSERQLDPGAVAPLGPEGAPGPAGNAGAAGTHPLRIVDAAGVELGPIHFFLPERAVVEITHPVLGRPVRFIITPDGYDASGSGPYYTSTDCSGIPYIQRVSTTLLGQVAGAYAYFSAEAEQDRSYGSAEDHFNLAGSCDTGSVATGRGTCCVTQSGMRRVQPAVRVALSQLGFVPPFRAESR